MSYFLKIWVILLLATLIGLLYKDSRTLSMYETPQFQRKDTLDEFKLVYEELGSPADHYKVIHVTGTNGKGSFCKKTSKALELSGYKVGLYTSPHLVKFTERISINGESISDYDQQRLDWIVQKAFHKHNVTLRRYWVEGFQMQLNILSMKWIIPVKIRTHNE